jgi:D-3-phosphoglycerate dehydrogenase
VKILNAEPYGYSVDATNILSTLGEVIKKNCDRKELISLIGDVDILIVRLANNIDKEILSKATKLKVIVTATTGLNHIDLIEAEGRGIAVLSLKDEKEFLHSITATAELTWSLILNLYRNIVPAIQSVAQGSWNRDKFKGNQLQGKTLGIVGFGRLGSIVAEYARAFRMNILVNDIGPKTTPDYVIQVDLLTLMKESDIVSIHINYNKDNYHYINKDNLRYIKHGATFINTSRGELVDEDALLELFNTGQIANIGTDVLENETNIDTHWMQKSKLYQKSLTSNQILILPHIGGATFESMEGTEVFMAHKLQQFLQQNHEIKT